MFGRGYSFCEFGELLDFLEKWSSWGGPEEHDGMGALFLLEACLRGIVRNGLDAEMEGWMEGVPEPERALLQKMAAYCDTIPYDNDEGGT